MIVILLFLPALALASSIEDQTIITHPDCPRLGTRNIPHEYDCTKYYVCRRGQIDGEVRTCGNRMEFSPTLRTCVLRSLSRCTLPGHPPTTEKPEITTKYPEKPDDECEKGSCEEEESPPSDECYDNECDDEGSGTPPGDDHDDCSEESEELEEDKKCEKECQVLPWPHEDCDKYWICYGKKAVLVVCAEGLHFNPSTNTCDFACNAGCVRDKVQATAGNDGLKLYLPWNKIDDNTKSLLKFLTI